MTLYKSQKNRTLTGTLGGICDHTGLNYQWAKLTFIALLLVTGGGALLVYLIFYFLMPKPNAGAARTGRGKLLLSSVGATLKMMLTHTAFIWQDSKYRLMFGVTFLSLGFIWATAGLTIVPAVLLVLGAALAFDSFGLAAKQRQLWLGRGNNFKVFGRPN